MNNANANDGSNDGAGAGAGGDMIHSHIIHNQHRKKPEKPVRSWARGIIVRRSCHSKLASWYTKADGCLNMLSVTFMALSSSAVFATMNPSIDSSLDGIPHGNAILSWAVGLIGAVSTIIQALIKALNYATLAEQHRMAAKQCTRLRFRLEFIVWDNFVDDGYLKMEKLGEWAREYEDFLESSPDIPQDMFVREEGIEKVKEKIRMREERRQMDDGEIHVVSQMPRMADADADVVVESAGADADSAADDADADRGMTNAIADIYDHPNNDATTDVDVDDPNNDAPMKPVSQGPYNLSFTILQDEKKKQQQQQQPQSQQQQPQKQQQQRRQYFPSHSTTQPPPPLKTQHGDEFAVNPIAKKIWMDADKEASAHKKKNESGDGGIVVGDGGGKHPKTETLPSTVTSQSHPDESTPLMSTTKQIPAKIGERRQLDDGESRVVSQMPRMVDAGANADDGDDDEDAGSAMVNAIADVDDDPKNDAVADVDNDPKNDAPTDVDVDDPNNDAPMKPVSQGPYNFSSTILQDEKKKQQQQQPQKQQQQKQPQKQQKQQQRRQYFPSHSKTQPPPPLKTQHGDEFAVKPIAKKIWMDDNKEASARKKKKNESGDGGIVVGDGGGKHPKTETLPSTVTSQSHPDESTPLLSTTKQIPVKIGERTQLDDGESRVVSQMPRMADAGANADDDDGDGDEDEDAGSAMVNAVADVDDDPKNDAVADIDNDPKNDAPTDVDVDVYDPNNDAAMKPVSQGPYNFSFTILQDEKKKQLQQQRRLYFPFHSTMQPPPPLKTQHGDEFAANPIAKKIWMDDNKEASARKKNESGDGGIVVGDGGGKHPKTETLPSTVTSQSHPDESNLLLSTTKQIPAKIGERRQLDDGESHAVSQMPRMADAGSNADDDYGDEDAGSAMVNAVADVDDDPKNDAVADVDNDPKNDAPTDVDVDVDVDVDDPNNDAPMKPVSQGPYNFSFTILQDGKKKQLQQQPQQQQQQRRLYFPSHSTTQPPPPLKTQHGDEFAANPIAKKIWMDDNKEASAHKKKKNESGDGGDGGGKHPKTETLPSTVTSQSHPDESTPLLSTTKQIPAKIGERRQLDGESHAVSQMPRMADAGSNADDDYGDGDEDAGSAMVNAIADVDDDPKNDAVADIDNDPKNDAPTDVDVDVDVDVDDPNNDAPMKPVSQGPYNFSFTILQEEKKKQLQQQPQQQQQPQKQQQRRQYFPSHSTTQPPPPLKTQHGNEFTVKPIAKKIWMDTDKEASALKKKKNESGDGGIVVGDGGGKHPKTETLPSTVTSQSHPDESTPLLSTVGIVDMEKKNSQISKPTYADILVRNLIGNDPGHNPNAHTTNTRVKED